MIRKYALLMVITSIFIFAGCETVKGVVTGVATGVGTGVAKDIDNTYRGVLKADAWVKDNLW